MSRNSFKSSSFFTLDSSPRDKPELCCEARVELVPRSFKGGAISVLNLPKRPCLRSWSLPSAKASKTRLRFCAMEASTFFKSKFGGSSPSCRHFKSKEYKINESMLVISKPNQVINKLSKWKLLQINQTPIRQLTYQRNKHLSTELLTWHWCFFFSTPPPQNQKRVEVFCHVWCLFSFHSNHVSSFSLVESSQVQRLPEQLVW